MTDLHLPAHRVHEWQFPTGTHHANPFVDVELLMSLTDPEGIVHTIPGFYAGESTWRVRFTPHSPGTWHWHIDANPAEPDLIASGSFTCTPSDEPDPRWVLDTCLTGAIRTAAGDPVLVIGDTVYNLVAMAASGFDVRGFMTRRHAQGFNLLRVRIPVSPFHGTDGYSTWQTGRSWPWGGSEQMPRFDQFNLAWFDDVDRVVTWAEEIGIGLELIMEAWGNEFPFNDRSRFHAEWELLWLRYLIARYDASPAVKMWTPLNEYEYYPNGIWGYKPDADHWLIRISRWIRANTADNTLIALHNGPQMPPFAERLRLDPTCVDLIMYQDWGTTGPHDSWLAANLEPSTVAALADWPGAAVLAEWGYEMNHAYPRLVPGHDHCDRDHTRRGAWRGLFLGLGLAHGWENTWGPWCDLENDQPGVADVTLAADFARHQIPWFEMSPAQHLLTDPRETPETPRILATADHRVVAAYLPASGEVALADAAEDLSGTWFDPRIGETSPATAPFIAPTVGDESRPDDWVLILRRT